MTLYWNYSLSCRRRPNPHYIHNRRDVITLYFCKLKLSPFVHTLDAGLEGKITPVYSVTTDHHLDKSSRFIFSFVKSYLCPHLRYRLDECRTQRIERVASHFYFVMYGLNAVTEKRKQFYNFHERSRSVVVALHR